MQEHNPFGARILGLGVMAMGVVCLAWMDFDLGQPVPKNIPDRAGMALAAGILMIAMGATLGFGRTAVWSAAALTAYYAIIGVVLMYGHLLFGHYAEFGTYSGAAEQLALAAGGL